MGKIDFSRSFLQAGVFLIIWLVAVAVTRFIFNGLSASEGYSLISSWWIVAFCSMLFYRNWVSVLALVTLYEILFVSVASAGVDLLYRDAQHSSVFGMFLIGLLQAGVVASPILFGWTFDVARDWLRTRRTSPLSEQ